MNWFLNDAYVMKSLETHRTEVERHLELRRLAATRPSRPRPRGVRTRRTPWFGRRRSSAA